MEHLTLVLGGARSGKSRFAEELTLAAAGSEPPRYLATAEAYDAEMAARIATHRAERAARGWITQEVPLALAAAVEAQPPAPVLLIDCLTLWLSNHLLAGSDLEAECRALAEAIAARQAPVFAVGNEVGLGIVPENALARRFRDANGRLHQRLAAGAGRVVLMVAGLPLVVKGRL